MFFFWYIHRMNYSIGIQLSENDFVQACLKKETWALKKLYEDHYSVMYPVCLRYANCESDALDILHDGFIKVFKNLDKYQVNTSLVAWIKRIMVNTSIDYYRRESRRRTTEISEVVGISDNEPDVLSKISSEELLKCLQELTPAYRAVFNLYIVEGYSHKEIADILDISESTSRSNLVKARMKLREYLYHRVAYIRDRYTLNKK